MQRQQGTKINYNDQAEAYARNRRVHPGVLEDLLEHGGLDGHSRVLEVGCGTGNYIGSIQDRVGCSCWGIDPSPKMLDQARSKSPQVNYREGEASGVDLDGASFDLVFSVDVVHHVADTEAYFEEAHRPLKPGGRICTATDDEDIIRNRRLLSKYWPATVDKELTRYPTMGTLRRAMENAGLGRIEIHRVEDRYAVCDITAYQERSFSALRLRIDAGRADWCAWTCGRPLPCSM